MNSSVSLREAIEVYFAAKRLLFAGDPEFSIVRAGPLTVLHCHPRWPERDGFYALEETTPGRVVEAVRRYRPDARHMITVFAQAGSRERLDREYEALGYRSAAAPPQSFMRKALPAVLAADSARNMGVRRVRTLDGVAAINSLGEVMKPEHLGNSALAYFFIEQQNRSVCTGRIVLMPELSSAYVAGMDTLPQYRRQRLATALLKTMQIYAAEQGARTCVLCSSPEGFGLYRSLAYETLATMLAFVPRS